MGHQVIEGRCVGQDIDDSILSTSSSVDYSSSKGTTMSAGKAPLSFEDISLGVLIRSKASGRLFRGTWNKEPVTVKVRMGWLQELHVACAWMPCQPLLSHHAAASLPQQQPCDSMQALRRWHQIVSQSQPTRQRAAGDGALHPRVCACDWRLCSGGGSCLLPAVPPQPCARVPLRHTHLERSASHKRCAPKSHYATQLCTASHTCQRDRLIRHRDPGCLLFCVWRQEGRGSCLS